MLRVFYRPADAWVGDAIPFWKDGYKVYFLADKRAGGTYGEHTDWDLVETSDLLHFTERGTAIPHGGEDARDRNAYTGSVLIDRDGIHHIFYTGHNPGIERDGTPLQVVLHAVSDDGAIWRKDTAFALYGDDRTYEVHDWRDPCVFWSDDEGCYVMLVTARLKGQSARAGGCIAMLCSNDLVLWEYGPPFFHGNRYVTLECPDYFRMGDWHYLVYSTFSDRFVTHYRKSRSFRGPYLAPAVDTFDGRGCYAIKTAGTGAQRAAFGWVPSKTEQSDFGDWEWAGTLIAHDLWQDETGNLNVRLPEALSAAFAKWVPEAVAPSGEDGFRLESVDGQAISVLGDLPTQVLVEASFSDWRQTREFGLAFRCDETLDRGYFIRFEPAFNRIVFDMWPRREPGEFQWQIAGDRPFILELERSFDFGSAVEILVRLVVEDDIFVLNVNDSIAMTGRCYNFRSGKLGFFVREGALNVSGIKAFSTLET